MIVRIERAFLLRKYDFRNTSLITTFLTDNGKLKGIIKGAKQPKKGGVRIDYLSEFSFEYRQKETESDLKNFYNFESINFYQLQGEFIYKLFFLNEMIDKFLLENIHSDKLFWNYKNFLSSKDEASYVNACFSLFETLGFSINYNEDISGEDIIKDKKYDFDGYAFIRNDNGYFCGVDILTLEPKIANKIIQIFISHHMKSNFKSQAFLR